MKTTTLFELSFLDLIKALFFGKKITLTLGTGGFYGTVPTDFNMGGAVAGSTSDFDEDTFELYSDLFSDTGPYSYRSNAFNLDPFDRM